MSEWISNLCRALPDICKKQFNNLQEMQTRQGTRNTCRICTRSYKNNQSWILLNSPFLKAP